MNQPITRSALKELKPHTLLSPKYPNRKSRRKRIAKHGWQYDNNRKLTKSRYKWIVKHCGGNLK